MNKEVRLLPQSLLLWSLLTLPAIGFGHGNNDGHAPVYDPVDKEFGSYSPDYKPTRTIVVEMYDSMRFSPDRITVKAGEVIRFTG